MLLKRLDDHHDHDGNQDQRRKFIVETIELVATVVLTRGKNLDDMTAVEVVEEQWEHQ